MRKSHSFLFIKHFYCTPVTVCKLELSNNRIQGASMGIVIDGIYERIGVKQNACCYKLSSVDT